MTQVSSPHLLITGISGFLGWYLAEQASQQYRVTGTYHRRFVNHPAIATLPLDLTNTQQVEQCLDQDRPDIVLHLAALSNASYCEQHPAASHAVNFAATVNLARACAQRGIFLICASTDLVFDGTAAPYVETDSVSPISVYGQHKAEAEVVVLQDYPAAAIARLPLLYGTESWQPSFLSHWFEQIRQGQTINAFTDEYRTAVDGWTAAQGLLLLLANEVSGVWHLGGRERLSRYDFAVRAAQAAGLPTDLIRPALQSDFNFAAARPPDVSLDSRKARALGYPG